METIPACEIPFSSQRDLYSATANGLRNYSPPAQNLLPVAGNAQEHFTSSKAADVSPTINPDSLPPPHTSQISSGELLTILFQHYPILSSLCPNVHACDLINLARSSRKIRDVIQETLGGGSIAEKTSRWTCGGLCTVKLNCWSCNRSLCRDCRYLRIIGVPHLCNAACVYYCRWKKEFGRTFCRDCWKLGMGGGLGMDATHSVGAIEAGGGWGMSDFGAWLIALALMHGTNSSGCLTICGDV